MPFLSSARNDGPAALHRALAQHARARFLPRTPDDVVEPMTEAIDSLERTFVEGERAAVAARAAQAPTDPAGFRAWFEALEQNGPGQHDPLFDYLETDATREELRWFLAQERAGEAGFEDLVALTQVKMPTRAKLELAKNYWDEMGGGHAAGMHGPMLEKLGEELRLDDVPGEIVWESLALANLLSAFALDRRYAFHSVGALGAVELTAPGRCKKVERGLARVGIGSAARRYYALHAVIDLTHSRRWNDDVLEPIVAARPDTARWIAEGALARLAAGERLYRRYRAHLGVEAPVTAAA